MATEDRMSIPVWHAVNRRRFLATGAAAGAALATPSILRAQEGVRIGIIRPLTGPLASSFEALMASATIGIDEINANGGILGKPIIKYEVDDAGAPAQQPHRVGTLGSMAGVNLFGSNAAGADPGDRTLASGASETLCIHVALPSGATTGEGVTSTAEFHFEAEQTKNNP